MSDAVKIARIESERELTRIALSELASFVRNPVTVMITGFVIVEALEKREKIGHVNAAAIEGALIMPAMIQSLGQAASVVIPSLITALK